MQSRHSTRSPCSSIVQIAVGAALSGARTSAKMAFGVLTASSEPSLRLVYTPDRPGWVRSGASAALATETSAATERAIEALRNRLLLVFMAVFLIASRRLDRRRRTA